MNPPAPLPWWRTPWLAVPVWGTATLVGIAVAEHRLRTRPPSPSGRWEPPPACPATFDANEGVLGGVGYQEFRTRGGKEQDQLPMVVALHGRDSTPMEIAAALSALPVPARVIVPAGFEPSDQSAMPRRWVDVPSSSPDFPQALADTAVELDEFLSLLPVCRPTLGLPVVAGYDEGATLAYTVAAEEPDLLGAAVGAGGAISAAWTGQPRVATTVIHGRDDGVFPYAAVSEAVASMVGAGAPITLVPMTGVGHSFSGALQLKWIAEVARALDAQRVAT